MRLYEPRRPIGRCPSHPGALLAEIIPATGKTKVEIAGLLGISRQQATYLPLPSPRLH
jgi:antitoxin HigA-1